MKPDLIVFRSSESIPLVLDFSIPHQAEHHKYDVIQEMVARKSRKYATWHAGRVQMEPFVFSTMTIPHERTVRVVCELEKLAVRRGFSREAFAKMKLSLVRFEAYRRKSLRARQAAGTFDAIPDSSSVDSDGNDAG